MLNPLVVLLTLIAGSFGNMLIYRLNNGISLLKPSRSICPRCKHRLSFWDLIPIFSFIFLQGKCRYCRKKINWTYLGLELLCLFWGIVFCFYSDWQLLVISLILSYILFSDFLYQEIPYTFSVSLALAVIGFNYMHLLNRWVAVVFTLLFFALIIIVGKHVAKKQVFGGADLLLFTILAAALPLNEFILLLYLSFLTGTVVGLTLLLTKKVKRGHYLPFAPFIVLAYWLVLAFGQPIIVWYGGVLGV